MKTRLALLVLLASVIPAFASAQTQVTPGDRVRVHLSDGGEMVGNVLEQGEGYWLVETQSPKAAVEVPVASITSLEVSLGMGSRVLKGLGNGLLVGGEIGAGLGMLAALSTEDSEWGLTTRLVGWVLSVRGRFRSLVRNAAGFHPRHREGVLIGVPEISEPPLQKKDQSQRSKVVTGALHELEHVQTGVGDGIKQLGCQVPQQNAQDQPTVRHPRPRRHRKRQYGNSQGDLNSTLHPQNVERRLRSVPDSDRGQVLQQHGLALEQAESPVTHQQERDRNPQHPDHAIHELGSKGV